MIHSWQDRVLAVGCLLVSILQFATGESWSAAIWMVLSGRCLETAGLKDRVNSIINPSPGKHVPLTHPVDYSKVI